MDHKKISQKGGKSTLKRYGKEHYSSMGKKSAEIKLKMYGTDYFKNLSKLGVLARRRKVEANKTLGEKVADITQKVLDNKLVDRILGT